MGYIDELLGRDEQILYEARQHIFVLISHIATEISLIAVLVAAGVASNLAFRDNPTIIAGNMSASRIILLICAAISVMVLISGLMDFLRWTNDQYVITDRRVIQVRGILNKEVIDSSLDKINDVGMRQTILGRMFNFGTIEILTAAEDGVNAIEGIAAPLEFKRVMVEAKHSHDHGYGYLVDPRTAYPTPSTANPVRGQGDIQRILEELAALRDGGILSNEEFETKKRDLLSRL